jgi:drug/metabolite transporter (DMT)-like permease
LQGFFISNHINRCGDSVTASAVCGNSFGIKSGEMKAADIVLLIALAAIWGSSYVFLRMVTPVMGVTHTLATRVILAAIVMTLIFRSRNKFNGFKTYRRHYLVLGIFNILLPFSLITYSVSHLTTSLSAMLNATTPIFTMVISSVWLKERMNVTKLASIFVALSGLAVLLGWMPVELSGKGIISILLSLLAAVSYGIGAVYTKLSIKKVNPLQTATGMIASAAVIMLPVLLLTPSGHSIPATDIAISLMVFGVVCTAAGYTIYFRLISSAGASNTSMVSLLVPVFSVIWGLVFFGEQVTPALVIGLALILASLKILLSGTAIKTQS